jgi:hypothetical protein
VLEAQQAILLDALRRAGGAPVSYDELREEGVEYPAGVVFELELAGVPIERFQGGGGGQRRVIGVRLRPDRLDQALRRAPEREAAPKPEQASVPVSERIPEPEPLPEPEPIPGPESVPGPEFAPKPVHVGRRPSPHWGPVHVYRTSVARVLAEAAAGGLLSAGAAGRRIARTPSARLLAPLAVLGAAGLAIVLVLSGLGGPAGHSPGAAIVRYRAAPRLVAAAPRKIGAVAPRARPCGAASTTSTTVTTASGASTTASIAEATPVSSALATVLESQGHMMLESGDYAGAVPILEDALKATGESASACLEPSSATCLTYAYALYDLGRALRLSGHGAAAVPILEARLQIDNQRPTVAAELQLARQQVR